MENAGKRKVSFRYRFSPNYSIFPVSGVIGGLNPQGQLLVNFFYEGTTAPEQVTHEIEADGKLGKVLSRQGEEGLSRHISFGISVHPHLAKEIANWLNQRAAEYQEVSQEIEQKKKGAKR